MTAPELTHDEILQLLKMVDACSLSELFIEFRGVKLHVRRGGITAQVDGDVPAQPSAPGAAVAGSARSPISAMAKARDDLGVGGDTASAASGETSRAPIDDSSRKAETDAAAVGAVGAVVVAAPMVGVFYRSPAPDQPPFIEVGDCVDADQVVGIIEVMKLMNAVRGGVQGRVTAIHAKNAALVQYGEALVSIEPAEADGHG